MAFNTNQGKQQFTATAGQTVFTFNFAIFADTNIKVYKTPSGQVANDTADILTLTTNYTVSINGTLGGTVTLLVGAGLNDTITIVRNLPVSRTTDYQTNGDLYADTLDEDQDYQTYLVQDGYVQLARAIIIPESLVNVDLNIPSPVANSYLRWNATADALENDTTIPQAVIDAAASASAAATSETNAATSETNAATSADAAQLRAWEAEAERLTADSYATEAEDVPVNIVTSDGDGTFTYTPTNPIEYSSLHWSNKAALAGQGDAVNISVTPAGNIASTNVQLALEELDVEKQATLISGTNIKTVNSQSLLGSGNIYISSGVRQTVQSASVDSSGYANFISIGTGLAVNISATSIPISIHASGGTVSGDRLGIISTDTTISGLTAATTNYLYADIASGGAVTLGKTTLAPIYQFGGTPSVTSGQFTFNIGEMKGYLGNGSTATQSFRVFIGEAITGASTVTSVINYALNGLYKTSQTTLAASTAYSYSHNLGINMFNIMNYSYVCKTTEGGYAVGDRVSVTTNGGNICSTLSSTGRNTINLAIGTGIGTVCAKNGSGGITTLSAANWSVEITIQRSF